MILNPLLSITSLVLVAIIFIAHIIYLLIIRQKWKLILRRFLMLALIFVILLRPMIRGRDIAPQGAHTNVFFAVDLSNSMVGKDCSYDGTKYRRIEKLRRDIIDIAKQYDNTQFAILGQDFRGYSAVPLTTDLEALETGAKALTLSSYKYEAPKASNSLLDYALSYIEEVSQTQPQRKNVLYLMTDGEKLDLSKIESPLFAEANKQNDEQLAGLGHKSRIEHISAGSILNYGSERGVFIEHIDVDGNIGSDFVHDEHGSHYLAQANPKDLQQLAKQMGLSFQDLSETKVTDSDLSSQIQKIVHDNRNVAGYYDSYYYFALLLIVLLFWELSDNLNRILSERKEIRK